MENSCPYYSCDSHSSNDTFYSHKDREGVGREHGNKRFQPANFNRIRKNSRWSSIRYSDHLRRSFGFKDHEESSRRRLSVRTQSLWEQTSPNRLKQRSRTVDNILLRSDHDNLWPLDINRHRPIWPCLLRGSWFIPNS